MEVNSPPHDLLFDDVVEFFNRPNIKINCPLCDNPQWHLTTTLELGSHIGSVTLPVADQQGHLIPDMFTYPIVMLSCTYCAFIRLHNRNQIRDWVQAGKQESLPLQGGA